MTDTVENLILDLIEWVGRRERTYHETMEAWRTSCPRLPVWEDATERGLVEASFANGRSIVRATSAGLAFLKEKRPDAYRELTRAMEGPMRGLWRHAVVVLFLLGFPAAVVASGEQQLDPAFRADIVKLMEVTGSAKLGAQMASLISRQVLEGYKKEHPDVPARVIEIGQEVLDGEFAKAFGAPDGLMTKMIPVYAKHFDHQEVRGLLAFYETDLGRKTIAVMPAVMQEAAQVSQAWTTELMPHIEKVLEERLKAEGLVK